MGLPAPQATGPREVYAARLAHYTAQHGAASERFHNGLLLLLVLAAATALFLFASLRLRAWPTWPAALALPCAAGLAQRMGRARRRAEQLRRLVEFYQRGLARLDHTWMTSGDSGERYQDDAHLFSADLDLFGHGSLFQLLCTARTGIGKDTLARWLKTPAPRQEALARQAAIAELRPRLEAREAIVKAGAHTFSDCDGDTFERWLSDPPARFPAWAPWIALPLSLGALTIPALAFLHLIPFGLFTRCFAAWASLEALFAYAFRDPVDQVLESVTMPAADLGILIQLLRHIEAEQFASPRLRALQDRVGRRGPTALVHLRRLISLLELRRNDVFTMPSWLLLWGTQFAMAIERWRERHRQALRAWLEALGEYEAFHALAAYAFEHPSDPFAELTEDGTVLDAEALAHPLLDERTAVRNHVRVDAATRFLVVSGSNMSGKSTFLRAVGVNAVLARMGAPVRAACFRCSELDLGAAIRIQDSLLDGRSHFLAEMVRLRAILERAGERPGLLFLIDEIMGGTNSHDRRIAAEGVIRRLIARGAVGLVTTHDLALAQIAALPGLGGANVHFADSADAGGLDFDYRLREGVLQKSNALALVRMLGLID